MAMTIVVMEQMNHQSIVAAREELASVIFSLVIMETVYREYTSVTVITIVWITVMKITDTSAVS